MTKDETQRRSWTFCEAVLFFKLNMCGISGIVSRSLAKEEMLERLSLMADVQRHRGPDDKRCEVYRFKDFLTGFGFVRLSILDLQTGMQPIRSIADDSAIICNGQVYNYLELKKLVSSESFVTRGDIEVAFHLYRKKGPDFLNLLNGMYAGAVFDPARQKILLFRDRFGIKPLYYTEHDGNFVFASEIKPVLKGSKKNPALNRKRLGTFFSYRYLPGKDTMFEDIFCLPPGSYLDYDLISGKYTIIRYWEYKTDAVKGNISLSDAQEELYYLFTDAVKIRLRSDVEVGCFLSGGIDSSAVAKSAALKHPDMKIFSIAFSESKYDELSDINSFIKTNRAAFKNIKRYVALCGRESLKLLPELIKSLEEPVSLGAIFPTNQVCQLAGSHVKVVLTGEGADEIFCGYRKFLVEMAAIQYPSLCNNKKKLMEEKFPELTDYIKLRKHSAEHIYIQSELLFTKDELCELLGIEFDDDDIFPYNALPLLKGTEHPVNAAVAIESRFRLPDYVILRLDKLSMRHSIEARTPFLDYRLAEFAATLPVEYKINIDQGIEKFICRKAFANKQVLDKTTAFRPKQPFTIPLADWLSQPEDLPDFIKDILSGEMIKKQGIINPNMVKNIFQKVSTKGVGPSTLVSEADRVLAICVFTLWYNEFI